MLSDTFKNSGPIGTALLCSRYPVGHSSLTVICSNVLHFNPMIEYKM